MTRLMVIEWSARAEIGHDSGTRENSTVTVLSQMEGLCDSAVTQNGRNVTKTTKSRASKPRRSRFATHPTHKNGTSSIPAAASAGGHLPPS
jgi:hypothetical protein